MPNLNAKINTLVAGDHFSLRRTIDRAASNFETGVTIVQAWFTAKAAVSDPDPGLVQKDISTTNVPNVGHIENDGGGDVDPIVRFDLIPAETEAIGNIRRVYDIQLKTNLGQLYTPELGEILLFEDVTQAT